MSVADVSSLASGLGLTTSQVVVVPAVNVTLLAFSNSAQALNGLIALLCVDGSAAVCKP